MNPPPGAYQGIHQKQESFVRRQSNVADPSDGDVTDADKRTIYQHPLFPLLLMLFEKCELATQTTECPSARSIDSDIRLFITQMQTTGKSLLAESDDVDSLMVHSIEVLRMNLLELEKVGDLCKDFCQRYIACLKSKMQSDNLLKPLGDQSSPQPSPVVDTAALSRVVSGSGIRASMSSPTPDDDSPSAGSSAEDGTSAPSASAASLPEDEQVVVTVAAPSEPKRKSRRSVLPKQATNVMKAWLFQHLAHPYPSEDEKRRLAAITNLTLLQVNNWFINARRRILQPMLDAAAPAAELPAAAAAAQSRAKKPRTEHALRRTQERRWPATMPMEDIDVTDANDDDDDFDDCDIIGPAGNSLMLRMQPRYDVEVECPVPSPSSSKGRRFAAFQHMPPLQFTPADSEDCLLDLVSTDND